MKLLKCKMQNEKETKFVFSLRKVTYATRTGMAGANSALAGDS